MKKYGFYIIVAIVLVLGWVVLFLSKDMEPNHMLQGVIIWGSCVFILGGVLTNRIYNLIKDRYGIEDSDTYTLAAISFAACAILALVSTVLTLSP